MLRDVLHLGPLSTPPILDMAEDHTQTRSSHCMSELEVALALSLLDDHTIGSDTVSVESPPLSLRHSVMQDVTELALARW
jgi:hypothetical protein